MASEVSTSAASRTKEERQTEVLPIIKKLNELQLTISRHKEIKEFFEENFDDLYSYFDDVFNPEELILKSPKDLANYFDFVYDVMNDERGLDITDWGGYFRDYYNRNI